MRITDADAVAGSDQSFVRCEKSLRRAHQERKPRRQPCLAKQSTRYEIVMRVKLVQNDEDPQEHVFESRLKKLGHAHDQSLPITHMII